MAPMTAVSCRDDAPPRYRMSLRMKVAAQKAQSAARKPRLEAFLLASAIAASSCMHGHVVVKVPGSVQKNSLRAVTALALQLQSCVAEVSALLLL